MDQSILTILPNLSIGVISVLGLIYVISLFLKALDAREQAMRELEASIRTMLTEHLTQASIALSENTRVLARVVRHLDGEK